ncbi:transposase [Gymnodinialimonas sp. 57CJ19]|uniref:REP-associated tyrosine transposase n=1 Tax=Gymnodinialimonas sp. 57CJ19 TaxID=3138498 RepID=UPI003134400C
MPNYKRPRLTGLPVFFTVCLQQRGSSALLDHLDILRNAVIVTKRDRPFEILAYVVMPDHMHAVWRLPNEDPNYSQRWGRIKSRFSRDARRAGLVPPWEASGGVNPALRRKGEVGIWQRRFWEHHCRDEADLERHIRYCWMNPVKHGFVEKPTDWAASSILRDIRLGRVEAKWFGLAEDGEFGEAA